MNAIELLEKGTEVLDHGHVKLIDYMGSDEQIVRAARQSTQKGFLGWGPQCIHCYTDPSASFPCSRLDGSKEHEFKAGDEKLLKYLYDNWHDTPFEMADVIIEVKAPIFVFREWHRHRTQSYNEMSARYAPLPDVNYIPTVERLMMNSKTNKQAGTVNGAELTEERAEWFRTELRKRYEDDEFFYQQSLVAGVPKEVARVGLPVGRYSQMWAKANLRNWLAFMTLRSDKNPKAQWEIRQYANIVADMLKVLYPKTMELFNSGRKR